MQTIIKMGWRVGDAGHTVFGPKTGAPSPETIATVRNADNARLIVAAVNAYYDADALRKRIAEIESWR